MIWKEKEKKSFPFTCMIFSLHISDEILSGADEEDVAFLVVGDPFGSVYK